MSTHDTTVSVRMYNVGFGDAFLITVADDDDIWRMLVDCGVHSHGRFKVDGRSREIGETVSTIVSDLRSASVNGDPPRLDVVVATHRHTDHVSGFADTEWDSVEVGEVWVSFVENPDDTDAVALRTAQVESAEAIHVAARTLAASDRPGRDSHRRALAEALALNSMFDGPNRKAMSRLLSAGDRRFAGDPTVRFLPDREPDRNRISTTVTGASVTVLGPSRDPADLKRMDPPKKDHWIAYSDALDPAKPHAPLPLFAPSFAVEASAIAAHAEDDPTLATLLAVADDADLDELGSELDPLLAAAAVLERAVNNTSVFFVLDVHGHRLLFVGDSQEGAWRHVLDDAEARAHLEGLIFYKIGHHGSHNATPRRFVDEVLAHQPVYAMLPWGSVPEWDDTIPEPHLISALGDKAAKIVRADALIDDPIVSQDPEQRWTQITFTIPAS